VGGFLVAEALSAIGSWATIVVVWGYAAYEYDAGAGDLGRFGIAFSVPGVLLGPLSGAIIDRLGPKVTLAAAKVIGVVAALLLLQADDYATLTLLCTLHGISSALSHPALQSMPPRLVDDHHLARTNALVSLTDEVALVLGPAVAGVGIALFGFRGAFVFDALTYALGLLVLPLVHLRPVAAGPHAADDDGDAVAPVSLRGALEGWRLIGRTGVLRRIVTCTFAVHLLYGAALLAEPLYVRDTLGRSESVFAALQTVFGVFLIVGGLAAARLGDRMASFGWVALGVGASGLTAIVYLGTPSVGLAFLGVALWGVATAVISGPSRTLLQRSSPGRAHGRVLSADFVAANAAELLGLGIAGLVVGLFGVPWMVLGLGLAVTTVALLLWRAHRADPLARRGADGPAGAVDGAAALVRLAEPAPATLR
jgi:predicted MFS family arabinose efflux permease